MKIEKLVPPLTIEKNDGLSIFFIGVGSAFSKMHYQTNVLVQKGGEHLLIDCGTLCSKALRDYGSSLTSIRNVLVTHSHADHIGGLEEMALSNKYSPEPVKPRMLITNEYKAILWEQSLRGGCSYSEYSNGAYMKFEDYFEQLDMEQINGMARPMFHTKLGSLDIKTFRTRHIPGGANSWADCFYSVGVLLDNRVLFTGDTQFDVKLLTWMDVHFNIEYIFHDCQLFTGGVHAGYEELKKLPLSMRKRMYLCHYGDAFQKFNPEEDGFCGFVKQGHFYRIDG